MMDLILGDGILGWVVFNVFIVSMIVLDALVFHRKDHAVTLRESLAWTGVWVSLALLFCLGIYYFRGHELALQFLTAYLIEESLSVDNLFVFLLIFSYFRVPAEYQHKVLNWGILGALIFRLVFILAGIALIERFHWLIYVFGLILIASGVNMWRNKDTKVEPDKNPVLTLFRRMVPVTDSYVGGRFFVRQAGKLFATPLMVVVVVIETTDIIFAVDSVPAVIAISRDPFIVYTSNAFAIMGLRALYFTLSGLMGIFHHLHYGLSGILVVVGLKMVLSDVFHVPIVISLAVVGGMLVVSVIASLMWPKPPEPPPAEKRVETDV
jgi:tellurite resistance protein TerC